MRRRCSAEVGLRLPADGSGLRVGGDGPAKAHDLLLGPAKAGHYVPTNYQNLAGPLIVPDRMARRTSSMVIRPPGAVPPHSNRVASGVQ